MKNTLLDGRMTLNAVVFGNTYDDVKAQLFAVSCNSAADLARYGSIQGCVDATPRASTTFEYYENGGDSETLGFEMDLRWQATEQFLITGTLAILDAEFDENFRIGNANLRPLLGLGNFEGRQDVNANCASSGSTEDCTFSFAGWTPALTPDYQIGVNASYEIPFQNGSTLTPSLNVNFVGDYYAFDTNIPEVLVDAHATVDLRAVWVSDEGNVEVEAFVLNLTDEEVITRAVVHSQIVNGQPANSVQVNWNNPLTWGISAKYRF